MAIFNCCGLAISLRTPEWLISPVANTKCTHDLRFTIIGMRNAGSAGGGSVDA
ncbi:MAG: hypothetical protein J6A79_06520 [Clostridia bacterium]|nr:hypothetical protein [Clostridia bacterium]